MTLSAEKPGATEGSRRGRRRRWTEDEKRRIVVESDAPGSSVSIVARRHDLNANMLFAWRREFRQGGSGADLAQAAFVPAIIAPEESGEGRPATTLQEHRRSIKDDSARRPPGVIEIVLVGGRRVIVAQDVSAAALARVIGVLERR